MIADDCLEPRSSDPIKLISLRFDGPLTLADPVGSRNFGPPRAKTVELARTRFAGRSEQLWGRENFCNAFIIEESGAPLWNVVELGRVVDGDDTGAPTVANLLRATAKRVRANSAVFAPAGQSSLDPAEVSERQRAIEAQADELDRIAASGLQAIIRDQPLIEGVFARLIALGTRAPDRLVSNVAQALVVFERDRRPIEPQARLEQGGYVLDYKGCEITWPKVRRDASRWTVNVSSNDRGLLAKLGGCVVIDDFTSLENAIAKARRHVDELH